MFEPVHTDTFVVDSFNLAETPDTFTVLRGSLRGETGRPLPYTIQSDNLLTVSLLVCLCLYLVIIGTYASSLYRQLRAFLFTPSTNSVNSGPAAFEVRTLVALACLNCVTLSFASFLFAAKITHFQLLVSNPFLFFVSILGLFIVYFLLKWGFYSLINMEFFGIKKTLQWMYVLLFLSAAEGILLLPVVILQFYFDVGISFSLIYCFFVLFLNKILTFYKAWQNFFKQNGGFLQTFLYFCALEIITTLAFAAVLQVSVDAFEIKF